MIIGIDVDGVVLDLYAWLEKRMKKYSKQILGKKVNNKNARHVYERYGLTKAQDEAFWDLYRWDYSKQVKSFKGLKKYFAILQKQGHELYFITARSRAGKDDEEGREMRRLIEKSLLDAGAVYDKIIYTSEDKSKINACLENKVDVMIDDSTGNILELKDKLFCIIYDHKYNRWLKGVARAKNWKGVCMVIRSFSSTTKVRENESN